MSSFNKIYNWIATQYLYPLPIGAEGNIRFIPDGYLQNDPQQGVRSGFVYMFHNPLTGLFKIGSTGNIASRFTQIRAQSGAPIEIISYLECFCDISIHSEVLEKLLHEYFKNKRKTGEWFLLTASDVDDVIDLFFDDFVNGECYQNQ